MTGICTILSTLPHILTLSKVWEKYFTTPNPSPQATTHFSALFSAKHFKRPVYTQCHLLLSSSLMNPLESGFYPMGTCIELAPDIVNNDLHVVKSKVTSQFSSYGTRQQFLTQSIHPFLKVFPYLPGHTFFLGSPAALLGICMAPTPPSRHRLSTAAIHE